MALRPSRAFALPPPRVQNELRVTVRLRAAFEDQVAGGRERRPIEAGRHRHILRIAGVLTVDHPAPCAAAPP